MWLSLHCISMNYPSTPTDTEKLAYRTWFEGLQFVLPCGTCRDNFSTNLRAIGYDPEKHFESRLMFSYIVYRLHNAVRQMQGKSTDMTFHECLLLYEQFRAKDCVANTTTGEGGCFAKKPLACTLLISSDEQDVCRFKIDPSCEITLT